MSAIARLRFVLFLSTLLAVLFPASSHAKCVPTNTASPAPRDPVTQILAAQKQCPVDAKEFLDAVRRIGARSVPTMVNFTGFHNPGSGAFFIFEIVSSEGGSAPAIPIERGDLVWGHFTQADRGRLVPVRDGLTLELIAWDPDKQFYNFYELVDREWFYRGDSKDILDDIQFLHRQRKPNAPPFGDRLRCSGCHINGGLVQKEFREPYNDWFVESRPLSMVPLKPDDFVQDRVSALVDASELSKLVASTTRRLASSPGYRKVMATRSMQERLRPLFCAVEINIESDLAPFDEHKPAVRIPSAFFVDTRLATADIAVARKDYDAALQKQGSRLQATPMRTDADHAWLTPVKAQSDVAAIESLVEQGVVDKEFVADVLSVDFTNPIFSPTRCGLLKLVPDKGGPDFVRHYIDALRSASVPGAAELVDKLTDPSRTAASHAQKAAAFLASCARRSLDPAAVLEWSRLLSQRRVETSASEISQNPLGRILEDPGRVVFPAVRAKPGAGKLTLTATCQVK